MTHQISSFAAAAAVALCCGTAQAQDNTFKFGLTRYTTHSSTTGLRGIGIPPGADAETGDATTLVLVYERLVNPNVGIELALGIPPRIDAKASGSVAFLGKVLSAKNVAPTLLVNYHFGVPGDSWRPYVGAGVNYTKFVGITNTLGAQVSLSDSLGLALQAGVDYALSEQWGLFASVATLKVKTDLVATGSTVLTTTIDFKPVVYSFGASYKF